MADRFILYHTGFYSLPNEVACCSRLTGDSLKLLGLIANRVNTAKKQGKKLTTVAMSRLLLKRVFGNSVDRTLKNYAKRLKEHGFIESYSFQGGNGGEFICTMNDRPENNPYVLLSRIENELIYLAELQSGQGADALLEAFSTTIQGVEFDYVGRLKNAAENEREAILAEYHDYLKESLQVNRNVSVGVSKSKQKNKKINPVPSETFLPDDVEQWSYPEFTSHFLQEYQKATGRSHNRKTREGKTVVDCIKELERHYRDHLKEERKTMMKKHIEAFFVNYPPPTFDPKAFLMADCDALYNVQRFLETGSKHIPYELSCKDSKGKSQAELRTQQAREAKQENMGISHDDFLALIKRKASGH
ncbi:hypothetical protein DCC85_03775 [Paenibacillus sp. CAA11]|uniref:hypothetical protein n=1 Tax=Paenibacillus sp. CAA11 TaxID=1532905 RepID=UPI000D38828A|nr:hypothetical protein [Paenibacillus sp. CAA11]AWB43426.1 hypothetical protein DCC85_03775 [Paenibacillus sp. CAA11]